MSITKKLLGSISRFRQDTNASVTVESALMLPMLVWWFVGSFVFFDAYKSYNRALKASYTVSDILSRQTSVSEDYMDNLNELFSVITAQDASDTWIRISTISEDGSSYEVLWSYATGGYDDMEVSDIQTNLVPNLTDGEIVVVTETSSPYTPGFDIDFAARTWSNFIIVRPRFSSTLTNSG